MIERPCAASAFARASTSKAVSVPSTPMRPAICNMHDLPNARGKRLPNLAPSLRRCDEEEARVGEQHLAVGARRNRPGEQRRVAVEEDLLLRRVEARQKRAQPGAAQPGDD